MNTPLISICIPTYNGGKFLHECIDSAINQSYRNIEIIIVDDCSIDSTYDVIRSYAVNDSRIKIFRNEKNIGLVGNWNRCIELSSGEWIKFLFQDDYLVHDCIQIMANAIASGDKLIVSERQYTLDESEKDYNVHSVITLKKLGISSTVPLFIEPGKIAPWAVEYICLNFIGEPTVVMFRKDIVEELGFFNPDLTQICDLEYFLRIACNYGLKYVPQPLTYFRLHKDSTSATNVAKRLFLINNIDPIVLVHELLYGKLFQLFRKNLTLFQKIKLKLFFRVRVYESRQVAEHSIVENRNIFNAFAIKYSHIGGYRKGNILIDILLKVTTIKRSFR